MSRTTRAGFVKRNASIVATGGYATATTSYPAGTKIWSSCRRDPGSSWMTSTLCTSAAVLVGLRPLTSVLAFGAPLCDTSVALQRIRYFFWRRRCVTPGSHSCHISVIRRAQRILVVRGHPHIPSFPSETHHGRWFCETSLSSSILLDRLFSGISSGERIINNLSSFERPTSRYRETG